MPINEEFDRLRPLKIIFLVEFVKGNWMRGVIMTIDHEISLRDRFFFCLLQVVVFIRSTCHGCFNRNPQ